MLNFARWRAAVAGSDGISTLKVHKFYSNIFLARDVC